MKRAIEIATILMLVMGVAIGCSSRGTNPISAPGDLSELGLVQTDNNDTNNRIFYGAWIAMFDLMNNSVSITPDRELAMHFNITSMIPTPSIHINGYNPATHILDVDVTISNPYPVTGYDVRLIIFTDNIGHELLNADDWTSLYDIGGGLPINPFMAYAIEDPNRKFSGMSNHTENLQILLPGGNPNVRFAVDASYPGNCEEPYAMGQFYQDTLGSNVGDSADAAITVADWQNNTNSVNLYCPSVCGAGLVSFAYVSGDEWNGTIMNNMGASPGTYIGYFIATSANSGTLKLFDKVIITVSSGENNPPVCDGIITDPSNGIIKSGERITINIVAHDPDGDSLTYEWDMDWYGDPANFDVDATGATVVDYRWSDQGFYRVACRISDNGVPPMSTICSRLIIQEGESENAIKIDDSPEADPNLLYQDTLILGVAHWKPISHAVYMDLDDSHVYYCNNAADHNTFGNHTVISSGPPNGSNFGVKIIGSGDMLYVFWLEYDTSDMTAYCRIKMRKSQDFGKNFGPDIIVASTPDPNLIIDMDVCILSAPSHLGLFYIFRNSLNSYYCYLITSISSGEGWDYPPHGSGQFRDAAFGSVVDPQIAFSQGNSVIHTFWKDSRATPANYYYDYSEDWGDNWHTDFKVTDTGNVEYASMAVAGNGNGYFVWTYNALAYTYIRKSQYGNPPIFNDADILLGTGSGVYYGIDVWVSGSGETVVVPMTYVLSSNYKNRYYYSYDSGETWAGYFERAFGTTPVYDIDSTVLMSVDPERMEIFNTWIDARTSKAPPNAHIYGDFMYLAER